MKCYLIDGNFNAGTPDNLTPLISTLKNYRSVIRAIPVEVIIEIISRAALLIQQDTLLAEREGVGYLTLWMRKKNLSQIIQSSLVDIAFLDGFHAVSGTHYVKAQPRGLVSHWIAGNVPTLAIFSLIQSLCAKNVSLIKIPQENADLAVEILKKFEQVHLQYEGAVYTGTDLLKTLCVVSFAGTDDVLSRQMSLSADCRVIWGGQEAVRAVKMLPHEDHCETVVFGPKYSFGIFSKEVVEGAGFTEQLKKAVADIILFDQRACSSPHVLFFEKSHCDLRKIGESLADAFESAVKKYPKLKQTAYTAANILNARSQFYLEPEQDLIVSQTLDWTILIGGRLCLEHPVFSRTVFIKELEAAEMAVDHVTDRVQTVGLAMEDAVRKEKLCDLLTARGVSRCVPFGLMHHFDSPWDGMYPINRLIRWVSYKK